MPPKNIQTHPRATSAGMDAHPTTPANGAAPSSATTVPTYAQAVTNSMNNITPVLSVEALDTNPITTVPETLIHNNMTTTTEGDSQVYVQEHDSLPGLQSMEDIELSFNESSYSYDNREVTNALSVNSNRSHPIVQSTPATGVNKLLDMSVEDSIISHL
ncbi:hypothetical protein INT47_011141 [Mucor saturninus]|uniref:Uncharacterized protein n=1 Tax=Mucor saturninus TaxID=64648 RepID=A0A8H7V3P2_9FUNG|nr:hypothetical protein INT47_011141 [Mucor saturninus]